MKWQLPTVIQPPDTVCVQVQIPNDPAYINAFFGALLETASWYNWDRDPLHLGAQAAAQMRKAYLQAVLGNCAASTPCPPQLGDLGECDMQFRQQGCLLQVMCADGSWNTIYDGSQCVPNPSPGNNPPNVGPGQSGSVCMSADASQLTPLPWAVNSGDTLTFSSIAGAGTDGSTAQWYCVDGSIYYLGICAGGGGLVSGDPLNTTKHMALLIKIGTSYYPLNTAVFTVPAGVSGLQPYVLANTSNVPIARGGYSFCVTYTNNGSNPSVPGEQILDFTRTAQGFAWLDRCAGYSTDWLPGQGWAWSVNAAVTLWCGWFDRKIDNACTITRIRAFWTAVNANPGPRVWQNFGTSPGGTEVTQLDSGYLNPNASGIWDTGTINLPVAAGNYWAFDMTNAGPNHAFWISKLIIDYTGSTAPFN